MITARFDVLFRRLVGVFKRYHETSRSPDNVAELGAARWDLELARKAMADERHRMDLLAVTDTIKPRPIAMSEENLARLRASQIGVASN